MKAVIFDVDGTLWDSSESVLKAWNGVFIKRGLPLRTLADIHACMGLTREKIEEKFFSGMPREARDEIVTECLKTQEGILEREGGRLYPGVKETLSLLAARHELYIVSNCESGYIENMLSFCGLEAYFKGFLCAGDTGRPKGENLKILRERYGLTDCVYVGDTHTDELACRFAEIPFVWVSYGFGKAETPAAELGDFRQISGALEKL